MKRKSTAYQIVRLLVLVLIIALLPISVWAQEATLTANVPSVHNLHIELTGNGAIVVDGVPYENTVNLQIKRHSTPAISATPDNGWKIKTILLDGIEITQKVQSGTFAFSEMCHDAELIVVFEAQSNTPQTGDTTNIEILFLLMLLSIIGIILCVMTYRRTRKNHI